MSADLRTEIVDLPAWMDAACEVMRDLLATLPPGHDPFVAVGTAIGAEIHRRSTALPPDPAPTTREPCGAWEDYGATSRLVLLHGPTMRVYHWSVDMTWRWYLDGADVSPKNDPVHATKEEAQLAAEDAAAELLTAGLRALGRGGE